MYSPRPLNPTSRRIPGNNRSLASEWRSSIDARVLRIFNNKSLKRHLRDQGKVNFALVWELIMKAMTDDRQHAVFTKPPLQQLDIHQSLIDGLPGEALLISSAMAFDSMQEALPFFEVSAKTARARMTELLPSAQGEVALRIGRVLTMAADLFGSLEMARQYLRTPNFALGGAIPRDLLKTGEGEQIVIAELQTQAAGGPV
jgi:putative toxin-antitoxin system antitoxin component (TIGR02293 family)